MRSFNKIWLLEINDTILSNELIKLYWKLWSSDHFIEELVSLLSFFFGLFSCLLQVFEDWTETDWSISGTWWLLFWLEDALGSLLSWPQIRSNSWTLLLTFLPEEIPSCVHPSWCQQPCDYYDRKIVEVQNKSSTTYVNTNKGYLMRDDFKL